MAEAKKLMTYEEWCRVVALEHCTAFGHDYSHIINHEGTLLRVVCTSCGIGYKTVRED